MRYVSADRLSARLMRNTVIVLVLAAVLSAALLYRAHYWNAATSKLHSRLDAARVPIRPQVVNFRDIETLPAPVQRYFHTVLRDGQPMIAGIRVQHRGTINIGETNDQWRRFTSDQKVVTRRPCSRVRASAGTPWTIVRPMGH
jgi:hypothetical protein